VHICDRYNTTEEWVNFWWKEETFRDTEVSMILDESQPRFNFRTSWRDAQPLYKDNSTFSALEVGRVQKDEKLNSCWEGANTELLF